MTAAPTGQRAKAVNEPVGHPRRDGMATGREPLPAGAPLLDTLVLDPVPGGRSKPWRAADRA